uniref:Uncharacterized protein n=1 Tax=Anguilla anguilla TaxID=7936 RepID=A0A0E9WHH8_ANGAN
MSDTSFNLGTLAFLCGGGWQVPKITFVMQQKDKQKSSPNFF